MIQMFKQLLSRQWLRATAVLIVFLISGLQGVAIAAGPFKVGIVLPGDEWLSGVEGLRQGMKALGYVEGKDVNYLFANARGDRARVAELTKSFLSEKVDVIFTITNTALKIVAQIAKLSKTPVVFGSASGPVESGIIPAYATPDTHITGVTSASIELVEKRLEILREVLPKTKRVAILGDLEADSSKAAFIVGQKTAGRLGLKLLEIKIRSKEEGIDAAKKISLKDTDALFIIPGLHAIAAIDEVAAAAKVNRIPFAVYQVEHVKKSGALLSYGSSYFLQGKQSAAMVDKILKGRPVYQLPIERPEKHEMILNLETAKAIGVKFSPNILNRADELVGNLTKN